MSVTSHVPPPPLSVTVHMDDTRVRVDVAGEVDTASITRLQDALDDALSGHPTGVIVNLADVTFMDSSGINTLIRAYNTATRTGTTLTVINCPPIVRRVLTITGVFDLLTGEH